MVTKKDIRVHSIKRYGWMPDLPDVRDHMYAAPVAMMATLPPKVDLRPHCPTPYDQGQLGSCTGNAIAGAVQFEREKQHLTPDFVPSRLFIYYGERVIEGTIGTDAGAQIRDGIKVVAKQGVPPETDWPYDIAKFADKPPAKAYKDALHDRAVSYSRLTQSLSQLKGCLASGYPFVFGFTVYDSFESAAGRAQRRRADAGRRRERARRSRGARGGLRRHPAALHRAQLLGHELGHEGLLHHSLRLPDRAAIYRATSGQSAWSRSDAGVSSPKPDEGADPWLGARGSAPSLRHAHVQGKGFARRIGLEAAAVLQGDPALADQGALDLPCMLAALARRPGGAFEPVVHHDAGGRAIRYERPAVSGGRIFRQAKLHHLTDRQIDGLSGLVLIDDNHLPAPCIALYQPRLERRQEPRRVEFQHP